jgi:hypothetical protein
MSRNDTSTYIERERVIAIKIKTMKQNYRSVLCEVGTLNHSHFD